MVANGDGPRNHPELKALNLPPLGQAVRSSAIATKTLLFVTEGDQNHPAHAARRRRQKFRALDKATGKTVWETELEAGATGAPMTYLLQRQAVRRAGDWQPAAPGGARRAEPPLARSDHSRLRL